MNSRTTNRVLAACGIAASVATAANAQTAWDNPSGGDWETPANWSPMDVPDSAGESASIGIGDVYDIVINTGITVGGLSILNPGATVGIQNARFLRVDDPAVVNNGTIIVNLTGSTSTSSLRFGEPTVLSGTGRIFLNDQFSPSSRAEISDPSGLGTLEQLANHTIEGSGLITIALTNRGTIRGATATQTLELDGADKLNADGLIEAVDGGIVRIDAPITQTGTGRIVAGTNGTVQLRAPVTGGTLDGVEGLVVVDSSGAELSGNTIEGTLAINNARSVLMNGDVTNNGTMLVNREGSTSPATIRLGGAISFDGTGEIDLNDQFSPSSRAQIAPALPGDSFVNTADHTIRGSGQITAEGTNLGVISADRDTQTLNLAGPGIANQNLMEARDGGTLNIETTITQSADARIVATTGGTVTLESVIDGGIIDSTGGTAQTGPNPATLVGVEIAGGTIEIPNARTLDLFGEIVNNGRILVNRDGSTTQTRIIIQDDVTLSGDGEVELNDLFSPSSRASIFAGDPVFELTNGSEHTIRGAGQIVTLLVNNGLVAADREGQTLELRTSAKTNRSIMRASGTATLEIDAAVNQTTDARIEATGGGRVLLGTTTITGGTLDTTDGLASTNGAAATLDSVAILGDFEIPNSRRLTLAGGSTNDGEILVNSNGSTSVTTLRTAPGFVLSGSGRIVLNDNFGPSPRAQVGPTEATDAITNGEAHTIAGQGLILGAFTNNGTLAPGDVDLGFGATAELEFFAPATLSATSVVDIDVAGSADNDLLSGGSTITVGGTLRARAIDGFVPSQCENFTVVSATEVIGEFDALDAPPVAGNRAWRLFYTPETVELRNTCLPDIDGDCELTIFDFLAFQNLFAGGSEEADFDGDGSLTIFDFLAFQNAFAMGCG